MASAASFAGPPVLRPKSCILETNPSLPFLQSIQIPAKFKAATTFCSTAFSTSHQRRRSKKGGSFTVPKASVGSVEYAVEPETRVKFETDLVVPGCSDPLVLLGTGYREKVFAIIGVKVYAAGFYINPSLKERLTPSEGKSPAEILQDPSSLKSILQDTVEKSLKISLVRDVDGNTFWNALKDVISPRIKEPTVIDESALSDFRETFQGRPLQKGSVIILTWVEPSKMLVSISSEGTTPSTVDAVIESINVTTSLYDAFFGESPVSPSLKASAANGLQTFLCKQ